MKLVLDTNIYCDFAEGQAQTVEMLAAFGESLYLPAVVIGELYYGFGRGNRRAWNERKLNEVIQKLSIRVIDVTRAVAHKYGRIYASLVDKGRKIPLNDVWIAACTLDVDGTLLTRDRHFDNVEQIEKIVM